jgi:hypothetical protein
MVAAGGHFLQMAAGGEVTPVELIHLDLSESNPRARGLKQRWPHARTT